MLSLSAELLSLSGEPALLVKGGKILFANAAACSLLGEDCTGKSFRGLFGPELAGMQAPAYAGEAELAGRRYLLRVRSLEGMRAVFLSRCEEAAELISDAFLYMLRSELMTLQLSAELIRGRIGPEQGACSEALGTIRRSFYRINRVLQNLAVIRGVDSGSFAFLPQPLELCALLRELVESVRVYVREPEILLSAPDALSIEGDPALLEQLVLNLLSNCLMHAAPTRIHLRLHTAGEQVILSVNDDGCGIAPDRLHTALERYRYGGSMKEFNRGPGLGLTAVRSIARLHGGTLLLESREGQGTAVRVSLSRAPRAIAPVQSAENAYSRSYSAILTGLAGCLPEAAFAKEAAE